ncbi:MAG: tRNA preQ1(34) S-adenosylmethionine ribosyltransferase-isomerase QueA [bacterium]|nr:tRNA preQ1(34) S-adenosylmethionine ribosyltransferase-isomerase QueA [bacterium]
MLIKDFSYELPESLIAQYPAKRGESRLLVLHKDTGKIEHRTFPEIIEYLNNRDVLVLNETKVMPARLIGKRTDTGGKVEILLTNKTSESCWSFIGKPTRSMKPGVKIEFGPDFSGEIISVNDAIKFKFPVMENFELKLNKYGKMPLPPYIKREAFSEDKTTYQTVYAKTEGACAAPTAGLHFTESILNKIETKGINISKILLHTGLGSFSPIRCENVEEHKMMSEYYEIPESSADKINSVNTGSIIAVGTTTVRTLESMAEVRNSKKHLKSGEGWTNKFIYPGYKFQMIDKLITNFHLPESSLFLLVCAFAGQKIIQKAYKEAIDKKYRFYSYGDAMFIL